MEWMIKTNAAVAVVVPCIVIARRLLLYRIPGKTWLYLWKILILRLLCPFSIELRLKNADIYGYIGYIADAFDLREKTKLPDSYALLSPADGMIKVIWLIGVIGIAGTFIGAHLKKRKLYCMALPVEGVYFEEWKKSHSLKRRVEIKESVRIAAPLTYGVIRPVILLPACKDIEEKNLAFVLEHEFIHIKHLDVLFKWVLVLSCSVYWYNPLIWAMYFFANRDIELSCDETVLKHQTLGYRKAYLNVLIDLEEKKAEREALYSPFCKYPTEERIRVMMKTEKEKTNGMLLALTMVSLIAILNIGTAVKTERGSFYNEDRTDVSGCGEESGEIPGLISCDEEYACKMLRIKGFSYIVK